MLILRPAATVMRVTSASKTVKILLHLLLVMQFCCDILRACSVGSRLQNWRILAALTEQNHVNASSASRRHYIVWCDVMNDCGLVGVAINDKTLHAALQRMHVVVYSARSIGLVNSYLP